MSYGLKIVNDSGSIQIDSTYRNMSLTESNSAVSVVNGGDAATYSTTINLAASSLVPLIAIRPGTNYHAALVGYGKTGSNYDKFWMTTFSGQTTTIDWRCFRQTPSVSAEAYGLRIKNASENLVYDSGKQYLKIISVTSISIPNYNSTQTVTHSGVENPYYILSPQILGWITFSPNRIFLCKAGIKKINSTSVEVSWTMYGTYTVGSQVDEWIVTSTNFKLLVCGLG